MWGSSFGDLAKKAAELQEQAASMATPTNFPSMGGTGGLFNLDGLQEQEEQPQQNSRQSAKASQPAPRPAAGDSSKSKSTSASTSGMFGSMNSMYNNAAMSAAASNSSAVNVTSHSNTPSKQFQSKIPSAASTPIRGPRGASSMAADSKKASQLSGKSTISAGSLGGIKKAPPSTPKGKLVVPGKATAAQTLTIKHNTAASASADSKNEDASAPADSKNEDVKNRSIAPLSTSTIEPMSAEKRNVLVDHFESLAPSAEEKSPSLALAPTAIEEPTFPNPSDATATAKAIMQDDLVPIPSPKQPRKPATDLPDDATPELPTTSNASDLITLVSSPEKKESSEEPGTSVETVAREDTNNSPQTFVTAISPSIDISFSIPTPEKFDDDDFTPRSGDNADNFASPSELPNNEAAVMQLPDPNPRAGDALGLNERILEKNQNDFPHHQRMDHDDDSNDIRTQNFPSDSQIISSPSQILPSPESTDTSGNGGNARDDEGKAADMAQMQQKFTDQLQRLEENYQSEQRSREAEYERSLANLKQQVKEKEWKSEQQSLTLSKQLESSTKEVELLQKQLHQAKELLADKEREDRRLQEAHLKQLRDMEKQVFKKEDVSNDLHKTIGELQQSLDASKDDMKKSQEEYNALKERAKGVATELKERRVECRTLSSEVEILKANNRDLQDKITNLEAAGMDMNSTTEQTQEELGSLRLQLSEKEQKLSEAQNAIDSEKKKGEDALSAYKKKAQQSLALANSRAASAIQSKEEAEMEARAARTTADSAMQRAMAAESSGKQALAEAKQYVFDMEKEVSKYTDLKHSFEEAVKKLNVARSEASKFQELNEKLKCELTSVSGRFEAEQATVNDFKNNLSASQKRSNELYDEAERLRRDCQRHQDEIRRLSEGSTDVLKAEPKVVIRHERNAEAEATISMLKQELADANQAIKDLKETLKATMEEREAIQPQSNGSMNGHSEGGMPLFYAMEKQAELTQARDEIARLASLLGDAESTKQEALDAMLEMKTLLDNSQSKLMRQVHLQKSPGEGNVNLEYLKNVVLSYLNASTAQEKKTLLPVIGTVLCLTPEEQHNAIEAIDKSSSSVVDSMASSVMNLKWS